MKTCRYVLKPGTPESPAEYCEAVVPYVYVDEGDGQRRRVYASFCTVHAQRIAEQEAIGDDYEW